MGQLELSLHEVHHTGWVVVWLCGYVVCVGYTMGQLELSLHEVHDTGWVVVWLCGVGVCGSTPSDPKVPVGGGCV